MSIYRPPHEAWHDDLPGECVCDEWWKDRGVVQDVCIWHRLVSTVEILRDSGWTVTNG